MKPATIAILIVGVAGIGAAAFFGIRAMRPNAGAAGGSSPPPMQGHGMQGPGAPGPGGEQDMVGQGVAVAGTLAQLIGQGATLYQTYQANKTQGA